MQRRGLEGIKKARRWKSDDLHLRAFTHNERPRSSNGARGYNGNGLKRFGCCFRLVI